ncbi:PMS1 protein homolog 1 isoform 2-T5 [Clarias gariepinus]|uniref:PMS1 protein homolog 1 isoform X2 n=1 Tax=Clarias gariepinus TaxID=13013 RepID=UPI00234DA1C3|nr:PMS1 protein homolog 1 isoform X2 [Clarias gariepinus]
MKALPPDTVRLLSSTQVITSVTNVVKELIENSLDAGSSSLEIKLENYGLDRIEVRDNGSGIKAADTPVMAVSHYTSKISCHEDLENLETYGFRGEALGSICAVSEVIITTKTADDDISTQYTLDFNGCVVSKRPSHLGQGTTVCALKLFKNLPVRRQYYSNSKKCKDELKKVQDLLMAYAIIKPELRIVLTHNKAMVWQKSKVSDHGAALMAVLGSSTAANLLPVRHRHEQEEISIEGYFPKPNSDLNVTSSSTSDKTFIYVNNRPVNHKDILKLVKQYYANSAHSDNESASRRFPILMVNITVPTSNVDVNLTPDKLQVMLKNKDAVLLAVESVLISLYGSYSVGNDNQAMAEESHAVEGIRKKPNEVPEKGAQEPCVFAPPVVPDNSTTHTKEKDSEASVPADSLDKSESCLMQVDKEISAESWAMGKAFTDPLTGECLEPVKLHQPEAQKDDDLASETKTKSSSPCTRPTNVIVEKMGKLTAYDLISSRSVRQPISAYALFEQDARSSVLLEKPRASLQDVTAAVKERWESLREEERKKYEEKAHKSLETYDQQKTRAAAGVSPDYQHQKSDSFLNKTKGVKRKAPESEQQTLDKHFSSQTESKKKPTKVSEVSKPVEFSIDALRRALQPEHRSRPSEQRLQLVNRLPSQCAWVVLCGRKLMLLNPFRVEESLLFKRLLENNILPAASLQSPIQLTDGVLGGPEFMDVLMNMEKGSPSLTGEVLFTDARLVANGFQIRLTPGSSSVEVTAMADCMPFYGIADLREILTAVKDRNAQTVQQCRPLKVSNYLEGEAVRMARQLPLNMSREDVTNTLSRLTQEFDGKREVCLHGRPFFHHLTDVPETDQEAVDILSSIS